MKEFQRFLERNDLMTYPQAPEPKKAASTPLGKKEQERQAAREPNRSTPLGELMARRQGAADGDLLN